MRFYFFILALIPFYLVSQNLEIASAKDSTAYSADSFLGADQFNNLYFSKDLTLHKFSNGKVYQYQNLQFGAIESIDLLNPLEITVFYKQFNAVVILDNNLNPIQNISFNNSTQFKSVTFATTASKHKIWIFNQLNQQLELFDYSENSSLKIGLPIPEEVIDMKSNYNFCWVLTTNHLYKFNTYGSLLSKTAFENGISLQLFQGSIVVEKNNNFILPDTLEAKVVIPQNKKFYSKDIFLTDNYLYIYHDSKIVLKYPILKQY